MYNTSIFEVPAFVQNASPESVDATSPGAVIVGKDLRIDTPAAAWLSSSRLRKEAMNGKAANSYEQRKVTEALELFGIRDSDFKLCAPSGEHIIVKTASDTAEFYVYNDQQLADCIHALLEKRASAELPFCRDCANKLLDVAYATGRHMERTDESDLLRLAGTCHFNKEASGAEVRKRADYARNMGDEDYAQRMYKLAGMVESLTPDSSMIVTSAIADAVDLFDHKFSLMYKRADYGMEPIEKVAYLTASEALSKQASDRVEIDSDNSIPRGSLMVENNRHLMAKWASDNGYSTSEEADDIVDCVASMPTSLRVEFCERFA